MEAKLATHQRGPLGPDSCCLLPISLNLASLCWRWLSLASYSLHTCVLSTTCSLQPASSCHPFKHFSVVSPAVSLQVLRGCGIPQPVAWKAGKLWEQMCCQYGHEMHDKAQQIWCWMLTLVYIFCTKSSPCARFTKSWKHTHSFSHGKHRLWAGC